MTKYALIFSTTITLILQGCSLNDKSHDLPNMTEDTAQMTEVNGGYLKIHAHRPTEGLLKGKDLNTVQINSSPLDLKFPSSTLGVVSDTKENDSKSYTHYLVSDGLYQQTRFGITNIGEQTYIFAQGYPTVNMPKQGQAIYNGHAAVKLNHYLGAASAISDVNFGKKTLQVKISTSEKQPQEITFDAVIRGNTFAGDKGVISSGNFYGKNAAELGGYFIKDSQNYGAFGGKKFLGIK